MQASALSVSDLNEYVRRSLAGDPMLQGIAVRGEVSNFRPYASGHWYFSLKDEHSRIACVMFRQHNMGLRFKPQDGMKVVLVGSAGLYSVSGSYQFYAEAMRQDGVGELFERYNALKDKLLKEGLFDASRKRPLPLLPRAVGVITSASGAVLHDIKTVTRRRFPNMPLILRSAQVQGDGAAADLVKALQELAQSGFVDIIIIGRGGGSMEDLWAFNEEELVRAIAACPIPVISAVGHETDTTLADFAADMRAPTPSAAAELAVPDKKELAQRILTLRNVLNRQAMNHLLTLSARAQQAAGRLERFSPAMRLQGYAHRLAVANQALLGAYGAGLRERKQRVDALLGKLQALGPGETLRRGYALAMHEGQLLTGVSELPEQFTLVFHDGRAEVQVLSTKLEEFL